MASALVEKYIGRRYERWLDYAVYHCGLAGIPDEANDNDRQIGRAHV